MSLTPLLFSYLSFAYFCLLLQPPRTTPFCFLFLQPFSSGFLPAATLSQSLCCCPSFLPACSSSPSPEAPFLLLVSIVSSPQPLLSLSQQRKAPLFLFLAFFFLPIASFPDFLSWFLSQLSLLSCQNPPFFLLPSCFSLLHFFLNQPLCFFSSSAALFLLSLAFSFPFFLPLACNLSFFFFCF